MHKGVIKYALYYMMDRKHLYALDYVNTWKASLHNKTSKQIRINYLALSLCLMDVKLCTVNYGDFGPLQKVLS